MCGKRYLFAAVLSAFLLFACPCFADKTGMPSVGVRESGMISGDLLNLEKNIYYNAIMTGVNDFVLIGLEGSGMNPHKEGVGLTWIEALREYNVIDFTIANELELWNDKIRDPAYESYSSAIVTSVKARYRGVKTVGLYAFSKGASGVDGVYHKLVEEGLRVVFVWLNDAFTLHEMPYIISAVENDEVMLYVRYSRSKRLGQVCKDLHKAYGDRENVDSKHVSCSHGGLVKYDTFTEELTGAIQKATD